MEPEKQPKNKTKSPGMDIRTKWQGLQSGAKFSQPENCEECREQ